MLEKKRKRLLLINMEYSQNEINEPINIDILLALFPNDLFDYENTSIIYRDLFDVTTDLIENFDIILISSKISSYPELRNILNMCTGKIVMIGGILAIGAPTELACAFPNVIINTGEAEKNVEILLRLAHTAKSVEEFKRLILENHVDNVCFYSQETDNVYHSKRTTCELTNCLPPKHLKVLDMLKCGGLVRMETSRGCPWNRCAFCIMPWKFCGKAWRSFSDAKIEAEIRYLIENGASQIWFTDEDFIGSRTHLSRLCSILERCNLLYQKDIQYGGSTSVFTLLRLGTALDTFLQRMHDVGINMIFIGIESGSESQLKRYNKGVTTEMNRDILTKLRQYEFEVDIGFIMFDADTNMDELEENLNFIQQNGLRTTISRFAKKLRITPHTALYEDYLQRGLITSALNLNELYYEYHFCDPAIEQIVSCIEKLDQQVLSESYRLQALLRSNQDRAKTEWAQNRLHKLRELGYLFLCACVNFYKRKNELSKSDIQNIYDSCLELREEKYAHN